MCCVIIKELKLYNFDGFDMGYFLLLRNLLCIELVVLEIFEENLRILKYLN